MMRVRLMKRGENDAGPIIDEYVTHDLMTKARFSRKCLINHM